MDPQLIPDGLEETDPVPAPARDTVSVSSALKTAVADRAWLIVTVHV